MRFWGTSAILPLISREPLSEATRRLLEEDTGMVVWWATRVECVSAISRSVGEGAFDPGQKASAHGLLDDLSESWTEVRPVSRLRVLAEQTLTAHPLRAADAFQLASTLSWCDSQPQGRRFVTLDGRLRKATTRLGFDVLPNRA